MADEKQELYDAVMISPDTPEAVKIKHWIHRVERLDGVILTQYERCLVEQTWMERARAERIKP